jgi:hypothetical protein
MNRSSFVLASLALCALAADATRASSDDAPPSPEELMKRMEKYAAPGARHAELGALIGTWDVAFKMPTMPGEPSKGVAETTWWIKDRFVTTRMNLPKAMMGKDLEIVSVLGWDNYKKKWVGTGASSLGTDLVHHEGVVVDPTGKVRVTYGALDEYLTGEHDKPVKYVTRTLSPDSHVLEVWDLGIGESGAVVLHFTFTRRT